MDLSPLTGPYLYDCAVYISHQQNKQYSRNECDSRVRDDFVRNNYIRIFERVLPQFCRELDVELEYGDCDGLRPKPWQQCGEWCGKSATA